MKARTRALAVLCFLLTELPASAQQTSTSANTSAQDAQLASVAGQVLRAATGEPLKKARILLRNADDDSADPYIAITDSEGRFLVAGTHPGRYSMGVTREGFISKSYGEDETEDSSSILSLKPGQQLNDLIFRLQKCAASPGAYWTRTVSPPGSFRSMPSCARCIEERSARKVLRQPQPTTSVSTAFFDLDPGSYFVSASVEQRGWSTIGKVIIDSSILKSAGGYARTYYPSVFEIQRASAVEVKSGDEISSVDIVLLRQRSYKIRGQVLNAAVDHPASDVRIEALPQGLESYNFTDIRGGEADRKTGEFELVDIPPGSYKIAAAYRDGENEFLGETKVEVMDADVNAVRIVITRGAEIHGRVTKEGKISPSSAIQISASARDREALGGSHGAQAKLDGTFVITGLLDGVFDISAPTSSIQVTVSSGFALSPIQLVLSSRSGTVDGTVKNGDGSPVPGATIVIVSNHPHPDENPDLYRTATTDQAGYVVTFGNRTGKIPRVRLEERRLPRLRRSRFPPAFPTQSPGVLSLRRCKKDPPTHPPPIFR